MSGELSLSLFSSIVSWIELFSPQCALDCTVDTALSIILFFLPDLNHKFIQIPAACLIKLSGLLHHAFIQVLLPLHCVSEYFFPDISVFDVFVLPTLACLSQSSIFFLWGFVKWSQLRCFCADTKIFSIWSTVRL